MHWANFRRWGPSCCALLSPPARSRCLQALKLAAKRGLFSSWAEIVGNWPLELGSGKSVTPSERMHWAKARSCCACVDPPAFDEPPEPADEPPVLDEPAVLDEPPPHAATSSTMPTVTARTPARRGRAQLQRQRPPALPLMVSSSWLAG